MDILRGQLQGSNPTRLEELLADRVVVCWLQLHVAEISFAQAKDKGPQAVSLPELRRRLESS